MAKPRITNNLPRFVQDVERKSIVAVGQALTIGGPEVAAITPRDMNRTDFQGGSFD